MSTENMSNVKKKKEDMSLHLTRVVSDLGQLIRIDYLTTN